MLFRTIINSTKILFLYLLIQLPSPKIKIPQNSNFNEVKKSVSDGKTLVANAITGKGVATATDATFQTMAANINSIKVGGSLKIPSLGTYNSTAARTIDVKKYTSDYTNLTINNFFIRNCEFFSINSSATPYWFKILNSYNASTGVLSSRQSSEGKYCILYEIVLVTIE